MPALGRPLVLVAVAALAVGPGCDRNIEPYRAGEESRPPDLARIFPGPPPTESAGGARTTDATGANGAGGPGARRGADRMAAAETGVTRGAMPPSRTEGAGDASAPASGAEPIRGRVELGPDLADERPGGVLFVIARPEGVRAGPPLAVLRIPDPGFPVEFELGPENVMIPSMRFEGRLSLTARLDADGNAMTRGPADLESAPIESVEPGATGLRLVLGRSGG